MSAEYWIFISADNPLPHRELLLRTAWAGLPVSYSQDSEDINTCTYLDVKINKWELKTVAAGMSESWIRIEILKGIRASNYLKEKGVAISDNKKSEILIVLRADDGSAEIDKSLMVMLAAVIANEAPLYRYDEESGIEEVDSREIVKMASSEIQRAFFK